MKHPVRDRFWILFCSLCALCVAAAAVALVYGKITVDPAVVLLGRISNMTAPMVWAEVLPLTEFTRSTRISMPCICSLTSAPPGKTARFF